MLYRKGEVKESLKYFEEGCEICKRIKYQKGIARSIYNIGLVLNAKGNSSNLVSFQYTAWMCWRSIHSVLYNCAYLIKNIVAIAPCIKNFFYRVSQFLQS